MGGKLYCSDVVGAESGVLMEEVEPGNVHLEGGSWMGRDLAQEDIAGRGQSCKMRTLSKMQTCGSVPGDPHGKV